MVQVLLTHTWQDKKQKVTMQLLVSSPSPWKSHLVLKQTNILVLQGGIRTLQVRSWWSGKTSDASTVKSDPHKVLLLGTPVCPCRRSHKLVMNWGKGKRSHDTPAPTVPMQQHKLNQHCQKNWPVLGSQVIYKNWRNRRPPSHLKKTTNHMKNLSIFPWRI